ncbi:MAG TPA: SDR family oxidoreductase [Polyangiaceae bacterium]|jgi:hypothetical protein|nr:SDR family oxidoreductase [Polyangiaceae bacterium]
MDQYEFDGKTVLVTGGSTGIGEAFARRLSELGARVILVARSEVRLKNLSQMLPNSDYVALDLTQPGACQQLCHELEHRQRQVDVLINNAGFATYGSLTQVSLSEQLAQIDLNVRALVELCHLLLPTIEQRGGAVLNVASTASFQPVPFMAVYAATKAFVLSFSEALWAEYRSRGVRIVALCPGATRTPFFTRVGEEAAFGTKADPRAVAELGLRSLSRGTPSVIHGFANAFMVFISRLVPRAFMAKLTARLMHPDARRKAIATTGATGNGFRFTASTRSRQ